MTQAATKQQPPNEFELKKAGLGYAEQYSSN